MANPFDIIPTVLRTWTSSEVHINKKAFVVGGHQHHGGKKWTALKASTIKAKSSSQILVVSGKLRNSIKGKTEGKIATVETKLPYAKYVDADRKVIDVTEKDLDELKADLKREIEKRLIIRVGGEDDDI